MKSNYVYELVDPRTGETFYIGKGSGNRINDHKPDDSRKGQRIEEIQKDGYDVFINKIIDGVSEIEALKIEACLIWKIGTVDNGGPLLNVVIPKGNYTKKQKKFKVAPGTIEESQIALTLMKDAIYKFIVLNSDNGGVGNVEIAKALGLQTHHQGKQQNFLTYSIVGLLLEENKIVKIGGKYFVSDILTAS